MRHVSVYAALLVFFFFATNLPYLGNGLGFQRLTVVVVFSIFIVWMKARVYERTCIDGYMNVRVPEGMCVYVELGARCKPWVHCFFYPVRN